MFKTWLQTLLSAIGVALLGFLSSVITARALGPEGRGLFASAMLLATLSAGVAQLGLGSAYVYHKRVNSHWRWHTLLSLAGFVILVLAATLSLLARSAEAKGAAHSAPTLVLLACGLALTGLLLSASQVETNLRTHNLAKVSGPASILMGLVIAWQAGRLDVQSALWIQLGASTVTLVLLMHGTLKELARGRLSPSATDLPRQAIAYTRHALKLHSTVLLGLALNNIDKVYLYYTGSIRDFGLYSVAFTTSRLLGTLQETLSTTLYSRFAGQQDNQADNSVQLAFRLTLAPMLLIAVITGFLGPLALEVMFGKAFAAAGVVFAILMVECVIGNSSWLLAQQFNAAGKPGLVFVRQSASAIPVIALLPLIPASDPLVGVASLLLLSSLVRLVMTLALYRFALEQPIPRMLPTARDLASAWRTLKGRH